MGRPLPVLGSQQDYQAYLEECLRSFDQPGSNARSRLRDLLNSDPARFCASILPALAKVPEDAPVRQFVAGLLAASEHLPAVLADPAVMSLREASALARWIARSEPALDLKLARWLLSGLGKCPDPDAANPARILRILDILAAVSEGQRVVSALVQLLRHSDPKVRSKATMLAGRFLKSAQWVERWLTEPDSRVRANVVESLWGAQGPGVTEVFKTALRDPNNRVVGNAIVGLYMLGDPTASELLMEMARHKSASFRATAAWAMGFLEDPQFLPALGRLLKDKEGLVRRNALRALARIRKATGQSLPQTVSAAPQESPTDTR